VSMRALVALRRAALRRRKGISKEIGWYSENESLIVVGQLNMIEIPPIQFESERRGCDKM